LPTSPGGNDMIAEQTGLVGIEPGAGPAWVVVGDLMTSKLAGAATGGAITLYETTVLPNGGPPLHTHPPVEVFYVLEGEFAFGEVRDGELRTVQGAAGTTVHVPSGVPHAYRNVGAAMGRMLTLFTPAGKMDGFFADLGDPVLDKANPPVPAGPPDVAR